MASWFGIKSSDYLPILIDMVLCNSHLDEIGSRPQCSVPESEDDVILVMHVSQCIMLDECNMNYCKAQSPQI